MLYEVITVMMDSGNRLPSSHWRVGVNGVALSSGVDRAPFLPTAALALNNGAALWESNVALPRGATELERVSDVVGPLAMDDKRICAAAYQGRVACFDAERGNGIWARDVSALRGVDMDARMVYVADEKA